MNSEEQFAPIAALDLDPIKVKLMHKESGEGWTLAYADEVEFEYRRFLYLMKKFPNEHAAPLFDVDVFWHYHILDTMKYAADCEAIFGYFLHHFPYVGLRGKEDLELHHRVGERMRELYERTYGEGHARRLESACEPRGAATSFSQAPYSHVAWSMATGRNAWSLSTFTATESGNALDSADVDASGNSAAGKFSLIRPTLSRAAT